MASKQGWHVRLQRAMDKAQMSQSELARRLGWNRQRVYWMLQGRRVLDVDLCAKLAEILNCGREWLAGWPLPSGLGRTGS